MKAALNVQLCTIFSSFHNSHFHWSPKTAIGSSGDNLNFEPAFVFLSLTQNLNKPSWLQNNARPLEDIKCCFQCNILFLSRESMTVKQSCEKMKLKRLTNNKLNKMQCSEKNAFRSLKKNALLFISIKQTHSSQFKHSSPSKLLVGICFHSSLASFNSNCDIFLAKSMRALLEINVFTPPLWKERATSQENCRQ